MALQSLDKVHNDCDLLMSLYSDDWAPEETQAVNELRAFIGRMRYKIILTDQCLDTNKLVKALSEFDSKTEHVSDDEVRNSIDQVIVSMKEAINKNE